MGSDVVFAMIERLFRRRGSIEKGADTSHVRDVAHDVVIACEREMREYERRYPAPAPTADWMTPGAVVSIEPHPRGVVLQCANTRLTLEWVTTDCLRVLHKPSLLIAPLTLPQDKPAFEVADGEDVLVLQTANAVCRVNKRDGRLRLDLADGTPAFADAGGIAWGGGRTRLSAALRADSWCAGMGTRMGAINLRGQRVTLWNDVPQGIVASAPFYLDASPRATCGVFWRDPARMVIDCGATTAHEMSLMCESDTIDYLLFAAATPEAVVTRYTALHGAFDLPAWWSLGYQQGGDVATDADSIAAFAGQFRKREMPCDVLHLGAATMDGGRALTVDANRIPSLRTLVDDLHDQGFQVALDVHPAVQADDAFPVYASGFGRSAFVTYPDGQAVRVASIPGASVLPDFARAEVCDWWGEQLRACVRSGIDGIVTTASTPEIKRSTGPQTLPDMAHHLTASGYVRHVHMHNCYGQSMAQACCVPLEQHRAGLRPLIMMTSAWADAARTGMTWLPAQATGWEGIRAMLRGVLNAASSGMPLIGVDVAGADGELQSRWLQAAFLLPGLRGCVEPWAHGQLYEVVNRLTLGLRSRLLPYLYACIAVAREYGTPVIRPLWLLDPADAALRIDDAYMVGSALLVAPVVAAGDIERRIQLPEGLWYDFWTNEPVSGGREIVVPAPLERVPVFVRAGAVVPLGEPLEYVNQRVSESLLLRVYPGNAETTLYEDHGEGRAYMHGEYRWMYYTCLWEDDATFTISRRKAGVYAPTYKRVKVEVVGLTEEPEDIRMDRQHAPLWFYDSGQLEISADDDFGRIEVWMHSTPTTPTRKRRGMN
ncbi:MAG: glycoside hydrolase family 31 protein [Chloroflexota bacterium]|nr:glycoside hydrolase family 31 protein [Chloroflexota bacterium]